jgi:hypothetical protein
VIGDWSTEVMASSQSGKGVGLEGFSLEQTEKVERNLSRDAIEASSGQ